MKRERSEYFKSYNAARRDKMKAYARQPEQKAKRYCKWRNGGKEKWRKYYAENKASLLLQSNKRYRLKHPDPFVKMSDEERKQRRRANVRRSIKKHRLAIRSKQKEWRTNNRLREKIRGREYRKQFPEKVRDISRRYNNAHPENAICRRNKRRALKAGAKLGNQAVIRVWESKWRGKQRVRCYWCGGEFNPSVCHSDHVMPLSKGGPHTIENLCISCLNCNLSKHDLLLGDWNSGLKEPVLL